MNQSEFNLLVTNVTAIANQTFAIQCGEFANAVAADDSNEFATESFDLNKHNETFDFQAVLEKGYQSIDELETELAEAWEKGSAAELESLLAQLPSAMPVLSQQLSGDQLQQWITHTLKAQDEDPFYVLHQHIMALFQTGLSTNDTNDLIREAIAFDQVSDLADIESTITPEQIAFDDLVTAVTIQSFTAFEWLAQRAALNGEQTVELLENCTDDSAVFEQTLKIIAPDEPARDAIKSRAKASGQEAIVDLIEQAETV